MPSESESRVSTSLIEKLKSRAERRLIRELSNKELISKLIDFGKDVLIEFIRTANSNPLVGLATSLIITDILYRLKVIDLPTFIFINGLVGAIDVAQISAELMDAISNDINAIASILHPFTISSEGVKLPDLLRPSASTIVYAQSTTSSSIPKSEVDSLLARFGINPQNIK